MRELEQTLDRVRRAIREWDSKQSHDRCHYYPEIFAEIVGVELTNEPYLPTREQLEEGCKRFAEQQYLLKPKIVSEDYKVS